MRHSQEVLAEIERQYVFGVWKRGKLYYPTLKELSLKYEIPYSTLKTYSSRHRWLSKRDSSSSVETIFKNSEKVKEAVKKGQISQDIEEAANLGISACTELLTQLQFLVKSGENMRANTSLVRTLSEALKNFASVKSAVGKPSETKGEMQYVVEFPGLKNDSKATN